MVDEKITNDKQIPKKKINVILPLVLEQKIGDNNIELYATNVEGVLNELASQYPILEDVLFKKTRTFNKNILVYLGKDGTDEDIRFLNKFETELKDGYEIKLVPSISGGTPYKTNSIVDTLYK